MTIVRVIEQLTARGAGAAEAAVSRLAAALVTIAEAELPGVAATRDDAGIRLQAPGLRVRAFGTRREAADPRLTGLTAALRGREVGP